MARNRKPLRVAIGDRIEVAQNGMTWSGVAVPLGTRGTVYLHQRRDGRFWRCVHFDGFPQLQPNGYPFGIGGDESNDYVPSWAKLAR